jgi:uncharacterized protein
MGLFRFLTLIFVIWLAIYFIKRLLNPPSPKGRAQKPKQIETFVACHKCGLHIPQQEAIGKDGRYYCSESHRDSDTA